MHIVWKDHSQFAEARWRSRDEVIEGLAKDAVIHSVGWKIYEDDDKYIIAAVIDDADCSRSEITIFKSCVIRKRTIK